MTPASLRSHSKAPVIWLTGLSGAGKTTLAEALCEDLLSRGVMACILDGDDIRRGLSSDLGFSPEGRAENNRRVAEVAKLIANLGTIVIVALISPLWAHRDNARKIVESGDGTFLEVYVDTPLSVCEQRDPKGHYQRARLHKIRNFTGISAAYEEPLSPDIVVHPAQETVEISVATVLRFLSSGIASPKTLSNP